MLKCYLDIFIGDNVVKKESDMTQPTIKDVAKLAGVSISTVSRVMNKSKPVSPEAQRKVIDAINKLGFKPNELARSLVMKKSNSIGILVKDIGIEYMAQIIRGAEEVGRMYHYDILLSSTYGNLESEKKAVEFLYRKQVEGIIIISENIEAEIIVKIREYNLPYILLDRYYKSNDFHTVSIDYRNAMEQMAEFVIGLKNDNNIYLRSNVNYDISMQKLQGYEDAMYKSGLEPTIITAKGIDVEAGYAAAEKYFKNSNESGNDALIAETDELAIGVINYCYDNGIDVPEQLKVTGFGGLELGSIYRPRLTTVIEPYYDIGAVAMRFLTKILQEDVKMTETKYLPVEIEERESAHKKSN